MGNFSHPTLQQKVRGMIANHQIDCERFVDLYHMHAHNLTSMADKSNTFTPQQIEQDIVR